VNECTATTNAAFVSIESQPTISSSFGEMCHDAEFDAPSLSYAIDEIAKSLSLLFQIV